MPNLKVIVLDAKLWSHTQDLIDMAKGRALRGARLSLITMIGFGTSAPETAVSELKEHVMEVWETVPHLSSPRVAQFYP